MNDQYIVFDDIRKEFTKDVTSFLSFNRNGTINCFNGFGDTKYFKDIGLKDINGKSIYADSSIVEFTNDNNKKQYQGYFKYDLYHQRMFFWFLCCVRDNKSFGYLGEGLDRVEYLPCAMTNFKIIDTIQENKLGLIK